MKNCVLLTVLTKNNRQLFHIALVFSSITIQTGSSRGSRDAPQDALGQRALGNTGEKLWILLTGWVVYWVAGIQSAASFLL